MLVGPVHIAVKALSGSVDGQQYNREHPDLPPPQPPQFRMHGQRGYQHKEIHHYIYNRYTKHRGAVIIGWRNDDIVDVILHLCDDDRYGKHRRIKVFRQQEVFPEESDDVA